MHDDDFIGHFGSLSSRCVSEYLRQCVMSGSAPSPLTRSDVEFLVKCDLEGAKIPAAWRRFLAVAHLHELNDSKSFNEDDLNEISAWLSEHKPPIDIAKASSFDFVAALRALEDEEDASTETEPILGVVTGQESSKVELTLEEPTTLKEQARSPWLGYAAASILVTAVLSGMLAKALTEQYLGEKHKASIAKAGEELSKTKVRADNAERLVASNSKKVEVLEKNLSSLQNTTEAQRKQLRQALEENLRLLQESGRLKNSQQVHKSELPKLERDLRDGLRQSNIASSAFGRLSRPSDTAVSDQRPLLSWRESDVDFDSIDVYDAKSNKLVWSKIATDISGSSVRVGKTLTRGKFYQWVLNSSDPDSQNLRLGFYVLSNEEFKAFSSDYKRSANNEQRASVLLRFKLFDELAAFVENIKTLQVAPN